MIFKKLKNDKGVTLIELILVIVVVGFVMAAALSFFLFGTRTFTLGSNQARVQQEARLATTIVSQDLRTAINVRAEYTGGAPATGEFMVERIGDEPPYALRYVRPSGNLETAHVFTDLSFDVTYDSTVEKYFVVFSATGVEKDRDYTINSTMLLENNQASTLIPGEDYLQIIFAK